MFFQKLTANIYIPYFLDHFSLKFVIDMAVHDFRSVFSTILSLHFLQSVSIYHLSFVCKYVLCSYIKIRNHFSLGLNSHFIHMHFLILRLLTLLVIFCLPSTSSFHPSPLYECITSMGSQGFRFPLDLAKRKLEGKGRMEVKYSFF